MTANDIRQRYLDYFARHGHRIVASSSLMPAGDPTLLFTNAGMNQFKDVFLGAETRDYRRACSSQKCVRAGGKHNDLDEVGKTARHHTFFEMLGNFSFGDYFKEDAIRFAWDLLVNELKMDPARLWFTVFAGDHEVAADVEAETLWQRAGAGADRVLRFDRKDNFWQMGETGPCGPCSEIHYYLGDHPDDPRFNRQEYVNGPGDDTVEIWNLVFMQYNRTETGPGRYALAPLPAPSVDTGGGLERWAAVLQGVKSNYETDLIRPIIDFTARLVSKPYVFDDREDNVAMRVIADHARATAFLITDGILPGNDGRGYVLRKIMRRAMLHGKKLGFGGPFFFQVVDFVVAHMRGAYPELSTHRAALLKTVRAEEDRFESVLTSGLPRLEDLLSRTLSAGSKVVSGDEVFRLYDSLGVPLDFAEDLATQRGMTIDAKAYDAAMSGQRERARASSAFDTKRGAAFEYASDTDRHRIETMPDEFEGYTSTRSDGALIVAVFGPDRRQRDHLDAGADGYVVLDRTPFYVESGGQVSDAGALLSDGRLAADVTGLSRVVPNGPRAHAVRTHAPIKTGLRVTAEVADTRDATRRNHTATHLLHAALRHRLGAHVRQAGSLVAPDRLRFDFTHQHPLSAEDRDEIERVVNEHVYRNTPVETDIRNADEAIKSGAMALFGEKYGDKVRVVSIGTWSVELCGGTHVRATGDIGPFLISEESGVAAGVRRIEALTGAGAVTYIQQRLGVLDRTLGALGVPGGFAPDTVAKLQADAKRLVRENTQLKTKLALGGSARGEDDDVVTAGDSKFVARRVSGLEKDALRGLADSLRDRLKRGVVVLAAENDGKVQLLVSVTKDLTDRVKAGHLIKELAPIVGGGGGGRPDFAEAGGKDPSKIDDLLAKARTLLADALAG